MPLFPEGCWMRVAGRNGNVHAKRANNDTWKRGLGNFKYHGTIWHTFVVPNFAFPKFACSSFPPPPGTRQAVAYGPPGVGGVGVGVNWGPGHPRPIPTPPHRQIFLPEKMKFTKEA